MTRRRKKIESLSHGRITNIAFADNYYANFNW